MRKKEKTMTRELLGKIIEHYVNHASPSDNESAQVEVEALLIVLGVFELSQEVFCLSQLVACVHILRHHPSLFQQAFDA
jgi:hypothetical protein